MGQIPSDWDSRITLKRIENEALNSNQYTYVERPVATRSYLILFCEVPDASSEDTYKEAIKLEENEFLFKKYLFYYSTDELKAFEEWYANKKKAGYKTIDQLIMLNEIQKDIYEPHIQFFLRLLIKLPFIQINFRPEEEVEFSTYVEKLIRKNENLSALNDEVFEHYTVEKESEEQAQRAVKELIDKRMSDLDAEI